MPVRTQEAREYLPTPDDVATYLNATPEESDGVPRLLMMAFRNVAAARAAFPPSLGEPTWIAWRCPWSCPVACRGAWHPRLGTVAKIAAAWGVMLRFVERYFLH